MKVLYVKNGSERDKKFQLQTMIYEENGKRFVKKSVLCDEALPHLHKMSENYTKLSDSIINPKVKLAKIIDKDERSLTFEYIDGVSLAWKFKQVKKNEDKVDAFTQEYIDFLKSSFKVTTFDSEKVSDNFKEVFGNFNYSSLDGEVCFDGISNIDLIFSNIIYKDDEIYIIDYEWVFELDVPINYTIFRTFKQNNLLYEYDKLSIYKNFDLIFIEEYVCKQSFDKYNSQYAKKRITISQKVKEQEQIIQSKEQIIQSKDQIFIIKNNIFKTKT